MGIAVNQRSRCRAGGLAMDTYTTLSYQIAERVIRAYSSSFGFSSRLFAAELRPHIYAIYAFVRIADEIVDTYNGSDAKQQLAELEASADAAIVSGYSANPVVHAFAATARKVSIDKGLIAPFFASMRMDLITVPFNQTAYEQYIYGSAEVVGLMCLKVFTMNSPTDYMQLSVPARRLGAAYQKVNFLRDIADDHHARGRWYFPFGSFETFDDAMKRRIIADIDNDLVAARTGAARLPTSARKAVTLSMRYYGALLAKLRVTDAGAIKQQRVRVSTPRKLGIMAAVALGVLR